MDAQGIRQLLTALNVQNVRGNSGWIICQCPFAPWTHQNGTDSNPSFGVSSNESGPSYSNCFSCGQKHDLYGMVLALRHHEKVDPSGWERDFGLAMQIALSDEEDELPDAGDFPSYEEATTPEQEDFYEFPQFWLDSFPRGHNHPYLKTRGVDPEVAQKCEVRFDFSRQRICLPYWDFQGRLAGMQGRDVTGGNGLRYLTYTYQKQKNSQVWIGEHDIDLDAPVILTEGPIDYLKIKAVNPNVMASMSSSINESKLKRLEMAFCLITAYDLGTGGNNARRTIEKRFPHKHIFHLFPDEDSGDFGGMATERIDAVINGDEPPF